MCLLMFIVIQLIMNELLSFAKRDAWLQCRVDYKTDCHVLLCLCEKVLFDCDGDAL